MLSDDEKRRYSRQITLPGVGEEGQERLKSSKVLVVGAGGLGSPASLFLAAAGVGEISIVDADRVDLSNLQRQIIHETMDIDRLKVESAKDAISDLNPEIKVNTIAEQINNSNATEIIVGHDLVIDGCDSFETRFLVHETCYDHKIPYVYGAVLGFEGQVSLFKGYEEGNPCYRCFISELPPAGTIPSCAENGVMGSVAGVVGTLQATEAIKELLGIGASLAGNIIFYDALKSNFRKTLLRRDKNCNLC